MRYIAIPQPTADWLIGKPQITTALANVLRAPEELKALQRADFAEGALRLGASFDGRLIGFWNVDYLSGTGEESWGFIKLDDPLGLLSHTRILQEVLERSLYVMNLRLQNFTFDKSLFLRSHDDGAHTLGAGRGSEAHQLSIAYIENDAAQHRSGLKATLSIGPEFSWEVLAKAVVENRQLFGTLIDLANEFVSEQRSKPVLDSPSFAALRAAIQPAAAEAPSQHGLDYLNIPVTSLQLQLPDVYRTQTWNFDSWLAPNSPLTEVQRRIIESNAIERHPLRILGPGGSGKTLLMQLLALKQLLLARYNNRPVRVLYIVHNAAMAKSITDRFEVLGAEDFIYGVHQLLEISTLAQYAREALKLKEQTVIDPDAHQTKLFQRGLVAEALKESFSENESLVKESALFSQVAQDTALFDAFTSLTMAEISTAIKGHGLVDDERRYVHSETRLSRLHGLISIEERKLIFNVFRRYHRMVFEHLKVLDSDDLALSLLGSLRTPIWELKRRDLGYDFVFVDEMQLFNENERRIFPMLTKGTGRHVPIAFALDEAQDVFGQSAAGIGKLGIDDVEDEKLTISQRSTSEIVDLALFVIERTTKLYSTEFPDLAANVRNDHPLAASPEIERCPSGSNFGKFVLRRIRELRKANIRQIAVICHSDAYWDEVRDTLAKAELPLHVLLQRGDKLSADQPMVVLTRPAYVGGQEFDAVIVLGLEEGLVPPLVRDNANLAHALEQQAWREMYISITRARYRVVIALAPRAEPSPIIREAVQKDLLADTGAVR